MAEPHRRALLLGLVAAGLVLALLPARAHADTPPPPTVPVAPVPLPKEVDRVPDYHGQTLCDPTPKQGTLALGALLDATYGEFTKHYTGSACPNGLEHQEGRALDWMVDSDVPLERAKAQALIQWLLAAGPDGDPAVNARRLGIMYLIWNDRMWRGYDPDAGWKEYSGCFDRQSKGSDTSCHRDHIHFSLTWDGASARTSFWSGRARTSPVCPSSTVDRPNGSSDAPVTLLNTRNGIGLGAGECRLAGNTRHTRRSYVVTVPVPDEPDPVQRLRITRFRTNSPAPLLIRGATTVSVPAGTELPVTVAVPLRSSGRLTFTMDAGQARVRVRGLGAGEVTPVLSMQSKRPRVRTHRPVHLNIDLNRAPAGSGLVAEHRTRQGWQPGAPAPARAGAGRLSAVAPGAAGAVAYRVRLVRNGRTLATSPVRKVTVRPAVAAHTRPPRKVATGGTKLRARVYGTPPGSRVIVKRRSLAGEYRRVHVRKHSHGRFTHRVVFGRKGRYRVRIWVKHPEHGLVVRSASTLIRAR